MLSSCFYIIFSSFIYKPNFLTIFSDSETVTKKKQRLAYLLIKKYSTKRLISSLKKIEKIYSNFLLLKRGVMMIPFKHGVQGFVLKQKKRPRGFKFNSMHVNKDK